MCSSFPLKLGGEDEVGYQALEGKLELVGSRARQGEQAKHSSMHGRPKIKQGGENFKNAHFSREGGRTLVASLGGEG